MKDFLEKGVCNDLVNSHKHPFFRKPFTITGCNKRAVQWPVASRMTHQASGLNITVPGQATFKSRCQ